METVLLIFLIDPIAGGAFYPVQQIYQEVTPSQCQMAKEVYKADENRLTLCLKKGGDFGDLDIDDLIQIAISERESQTPDDAMPTN